MFPFCSQAYIDRYNYEHIPICGAVDEPSHVAFSFHVDKVPCPMAWQCT